MIPTPDEVLLDAQYDCPDIDKSIEHYLLPHIKCWAGKPIYFNIVGLEHKGFTAGTMDRLVVRLKELGWHFSFSRFEYPSIGSYPIYKLDRYYPPTRLATKISMIWKILTNRF